MKDQEANRFSARAVRYARGSTRSLGDANCPQARIVILRVTIVCEGHPTGV